jgi:aminopeptidase YwaD
MSREGDDMPPRASDRSLHGEVARHLQALAGDIGARPPGSPANRRAVAYAGQVLTTTDLDVRHHPFTTRWWEPGDGVLIGPTGTIDITPNPYSPSCEVKGPVVRASTLAELEAITDAAARVMVLDGELTREQLMPDCFPFAGAETHRRVVRAVEAARPLAVIAVSDHWEPVFEDPDVTFASTTIAGALGAALLPGTPVLVRLGGSVHLGEGSTIAGRSPGTGRRVVISAHIDSKVTTPGAFDNAGGVAVLLTLATGPRPPGRPIEFVAFNGEDHADACGEVAWLADTDLDEIALAVNIDGAGLAGRGTSLAALACPDRLERRIARFVAQRPGWVAGEPWYESDHAIFAVQGIPALAITTEDVHALLGSIAHGPRDTLDVVDPEVLCDVVLGVRELLWSIGPELTALDARA